MKPKAADWYKKGWTLDVINQSWVENTDKEVAFLLERLRLPKGARILDLACGFGRHALALARKGYDVTGVDLTEDYVLYARERADAEGVNARFLHMDIRDVDFHDAFDAVLSMADGAIGYMENDAENLRVFDVAARALKRGGKHFCDLCNAEHAEKFFPKKWWEAGENSLALAQFEWDPATRRMLYGGWDVPYGEPARAPRIEYGDPTRLYSADELRAIYAARGMRVTECFGNFDGAPLSDREMQMLVCAEKLPSSPE